MISDTPTSNQKNKNRKKGEFIFQLFVAGNTPISIKAISSIKAIFEKYYTDNYTLDVFDIYEYPGLATTEEVLAVPYLIRKQPLPEIRMIGDFSDREKVIDELLILTK